jgi:hypothetical protein
MTVPPKDSKQFPNRSLLEPELRLLDERLARLGSEVRDEAPAGLSRRVFEASVGLLPAVEVEPVLARLETRRGVQWWGRLAMAASVGLAVIIASTLTTGPAEPPEEYDVALTAYQEVLEAKPYAHAEDDAVSHLLSTAGMSSYEEVTGELESLISGFEM